MIEHLIENYTEIFLDDNEDTKKINTDLRESSLHSSTPSCEKTTQTKTLPQLFKSKECTIGKLI